MFTAKHPGRRLGRMVVTTAALGSILLATAGTALADGLVTWQNAGSGHYLRSDNDVAGSPNNVYATDSIADGWLDHQYSDGSWQEKESNNVEGCLDSNAQWGSYGNVYVIPCNGGSYQHWYESKTATGWSLQDQATGLYLDGGNGPNGNGQFAGKDVYSNSNYGNSDKYQRWH